MRRCKRAGLQNVWVAAGSAATLLALGLERHGTHRRGRVRASARFRSRALHEKIKCLHTWPVSGGQDALTMAVLGGAVLRHSAELPSCP